MLGRNTVLSALSVNAKMLVAVKNCVPISNVVARAGAV